MESSKSVLNLVTPNCYMAKIDTKDAYYSIPILPEHQKFLKFNLQGKLYKFTRLPNGLCSGPRKFILKPPLAELRLDNVKIAAYIDELITLAYLFDICFKNVWICVKNQSLFHLKKLNTLGFIINSVTMAVRLTAERKKKSFDLC